MSHCVSFGKDKVMFLTEADLKGPSSIVLPEPEEPRGLMLPNGDINWGCPCLGNAAIGPCSVEFRESLSCFHKSEADPKGSDCLGQFREMNDCMARFPALYKQDKDTDATLKSLEENNISSNKPSEREEPSSQTKEETKTASLEK
ncbi:hypothetical protein JTE90_017016 [Oedothorax gibbosus]|uniref:CHCH domain-containing protein n=1 Tax=Oedothorax gibbosus TaxID=931172 RepID=A0AAV6UCT4_9ARAC|nr:hypothetical protein JTE90_017016 [Oedothorax gibbosus]